MQEVPLVSVCVPTYKHKEWLTRCVNSILSQKTDFNFEILVGIEYDDSDALEYIKKVTHKNEKATLKIFSNSKESLIYIAGIRTGRGNMLNLLHQSKGKYISFCEGDDYWIETDKLQLQAKILNEYKDVSLTYCNAKVDSHEGGDYTDAPFFFSSNYDSNPIKTQLFFLKNNFALLLASTMFRKSVIGQTDIDVIKKFSTGDLPLYFVLSGKGDFYYLDKPLVAYTDHGQGISKTFGKVKRNLINYKFMDLLLPYIYYKNKSKFDFFCHRFLIMPIFSAMMVMFSKSGGREISFQSIFFIKIRHLKIKYIYYIIKLVILKLFKN